MGEAPVGAASTLNCKMPVARVMWTFTVTFRVGIGLGSGLGLGLGLSVVLQYFRL